MQNTSQQGGRQNLGDIATESVSEGDMAHVTPQGLKETLVLSHKQRNSKVTYVQFWCTQIAGGMFLVEFAMAGKEQFHLKICLSRQLSSLRIPQQRRVARLQFRIFQEKFPEFSRCC